MSAGAYHLDARRGLSGLDRRPQQMPEPGAHQVVVRVLAASLNRRDLMLMDGTYPVAAAPGVVPLSDGVGEVVAVGAGVTRAGVGDRVTATYFVRWVAGPQLTAHVVDQYGASRDGMLATFAVVEEDSVVHVPVHLTDLEAATLTCAGLVAWVALTTPVPATRGDTVLIVGSGAVAIFALQHANALGARVVCITSSPTKAARLRELGADEVVDRRAVPEWDGVVNELTAGVGAQHVVDAVGLATLGRSVAAGAYNATVTLVGAMSPPPGLVIGNPFGTSYLSIRRIAVGSRSDFEAMNAAIARHRSRPVIDRVFAFDQAREAYDHLRTGDPFGKVVIRVA